MSYPNLTFLIALWGGGFLSALLFVARMIHGRVPWLLIVAPFLCGWIVVSRVWVFELVEWHWLDAPDFLSNLTLLLVVLLIGIAAVWGIIENHRMGTSTRGQ
jgi:hypothetical protein